MRRWYTRLLVASPPYRTQTRESRGWARVLTLAAAPFPIPARQTGRADFRHPAFRLASPQAHDGRPLIAGVGRRHLGTGRSSSSSRAFSEGSGFLSGVVRLITNHLHLSIFKSAPEVGALCSTGITRHQRSYCPVRPPP